MPSGRRKPPPDRPAPEFFLDRGLGRVIVADMLRSHGHIVHVMADVYPDGTDQFIDDPEWIRRADQHGWIALTKDPSITRTHHGVLVTTSLRAFALDNAQITGPEMARRVESHLGRIIRRARTPGPFVDVIHLHEIERRWPKP